jgi:DNA-binding GntR family transcriptional regulator
VSNQSKSQFVHAALRERILRGDCAPGTRLVLARLATDFGVSPVPVREAVRLLEAEGLVRFTRNVGAEVLGMDTRGYAEAMETVAHLEGSATALAAPYLSRADLVRARELNNEMREGRRSLDPVRFTALNLEFHRVLCMPCPNAHLVDLLEREWERLGRVRRSTFFFVPDRPSASVAEHDALLALIESNAPTIDIELSARNHKLHTLAAFRDQMAGAAPRAG